MTFNYKTTGLPENKSWEEAARICHTWLTHNMSMFGPDRINSFMLHQPVAAAKLLLAHTAPVSHDLITLVLLGPAKGDVINLLAADKARADSMRTRFGARAMELLRYVADTDGAQSDENMPGEAVQLFLVEGLSTMNDQLIGRARIDKHHAVRWNILKNFETEFARVQGQNPGLDAIFTAALKSSRAALEALDNGAPKPPQP